MDSGARARADFWVDRLLHSGHRLLFALEDAGAGSIRHQPVMDELGFVDGRGGAAVGDEFMAVGMAGGFAGFGRIGTGGVPSVLPYGSRASRREESKRGGQGSRIWIGIVVVGTMGFLLSLLANLGAAIHSAFEGAGPAVAPGLNSRLLAVYTWAFPVVTIWGFSARWLPTFLGLSRPDDRLLKAALAINTAAVACALGAWWLPATTLFLAGSITAAAGLRIFSRGERPPKIVGVHPTFPLFVRIAYAWLLIAACISLSAAVWDKAGGLWGASRHALTVGFISTMVFAIGQRVLPAFCGMRVLFSPVLMFAALASLNAGCFLRVGSEIGAYEGYLPALWSVLPVSAIIEMTAMTLFAANLFVTFGQDPPHLRYQQRAAQMQGS